MHADEEDEPIQVGKEKVFAKGHQVVQGGVDGVVVQMQEPLQGQEDQAVNGPVQQQLQVGKGGVIQLGEAKLPVIGHVETLLPLVRTSQISTPPL